MTATAIGICGLVATFVLIALRTPIAFALAGCALAGIYLNFAAPGGQGPEFALAVRPTLTLASGAIYELFQSYDLSAVLLFIALGHVAFAAGVTTDIYAAARVWLARVPGGLAIASIVGCGGFSAISGSSVACAATMGKVAVPEMLRYGYGDRLATGAVAAGGTLGALIPPSVLFILFGIFAEQSISKLFIAAVIPGLLSMLGYTLVVLAWTALRRSDVPSISERFTLAQRLSALGRAWIAILMFVIIIGGIYGGIFTATEAAAVSFATVTLLAFVTGRITRGAFLSALREAAHQTAAIFLIAGAAKIFVTFVALTNVAPWLVGQVVAFDPGPGQLIFGIVCLYVVLGMFLDPLGIMLLTLPFTLPLIEAQGMNPVWFAVVVVKLLEMGLLTPPVGLNVFVIHSVTEPRIAIGRIFAGVAPFFVMDLAVLALLVTIPALSLWLPAQLN